MDTSIIVALITGGITATASIITALITGSKNRALMEKELQYQQKQIDALNVSVKEHNNYAKEIPLLNQSIEYLKDEVSHIRKKVEA